MLVDGGIQQMQSQPPVEYWSLRLDKSWVNMAF